MSLQLRVAVESSTLFYYPIVIRQHLCLFWRDNWKSDVFCQVRTEMYIVDPTKLFFGPSFPIGDVQFQR